MFSLIPFSPVNFFSKNSSISTSKVFYKVCNYLITREVNRAEIVAAKVFYKSIKAAHDSR